LVFFTEILDERFVLMCWLTGTGVFAAAQVKKEDQNPNASRIVPHRKKIIDHICFGVCNQDYSISGGKAMRITSKMSPFAHYA
jgi:hypothetical protein